MLYIASMEEALYMVFTLARSTTGVERLDFGGRTERGL